MPEKTKDFKTDLLCSLFYMLLNFCDKYEWGKCYPKKVIHK